MYNSFLPRDAVLARYMLSSCVRLSIRLFFDAKDLCEILTGSPQRGRKIEVARLLSAIFDQYLAISQKRCKIGT